MFFFKYFSYLSSFQIKNVVASLLVEKEAEGWAIERKGGQVKCKRFLDSACGIDPSLSLPSLRAIGQGHRCSAQE